MYSYVDLQLYTHAYSGEAVYLHPELWQFNQEALQEYILYCCQFPNGGLLDKPGKTRDFYHTCYCLSGLSTSQHCFGGKKTVNISGDCDAILVRIVIISTQWNLLYSTIITG